MYNFEIRHVFMTDGGDGLPSRGKRLILYYMYLQTPGAARLRSGGRVRGGALLLATRAPGGWSGVVRITTPASNYLDQTLQSNNVLVYEFF